jgi:hypothetical protein
MSTSRWPPRDEVGGRAAQVVQPWNRRLASFGPFAASLRSQWDAHTSWIDDWDHRNPARGQCGTSTLALQDECGGEMFRGLVHETGHSTVPTVHYWNVIAGVHVDLTWQQFTTSSFVLRSEPVRREELLVNRWFIDRYELLRDRLDAEERIPA